MANYDWSAIMLNYDRTPPTYTTGDQIVLEVSGQVRKTTDPSSVSETVTVSGVVQAADGTVTTVVAQPLTVAHPVAGSEEFLPVTLVSVTDSSGRVWSSPSATTATAAA